MGVQEEGKLGFYCRVAPPTNKIIMRGFGSARRAFFFDESAQNHVLPVRGTTGNWSTAHNQDGSETRSDAQGHLSAQAVFARAVEFGMEAQPCPTQVLEKHETQ